PRPTVPITPIKQPNRTPVYVGAGGSVIVLGVAVAVLMWKRAPQQAPQIPAATSTQSAAAPVISAQAPVTAPATPQNIPGIVAPAGKPDASRAVTKTSTAKEATNPAPAV